MRRWVICSALVLIVAAMGIVAAFKLSPWPSVLLVRYAFSLGATASNATLQPYIPDGIVEHLDEPYGTASAERVDIFRSKGSTGSQPTVVWIHGGGFIAGDKRDLTPYLKILAGKGYTTVAIGYTTAPTAKYPTPVLQANAALAWLIRNAQRLGIDPDRIALAGDSAGAHIASQLAAGITDPAYAEVLGFEPSLGRPKAMVLVSGVYSTDGLRMDGPFAGFMNTVIWSYLGDKDYSSDPRAEQFSVDRHVTSGFPPVFITAGNADPLEQQSRTMADALRAQGVEVDTLFFAPDHTPPLPHEYQFNFDLEDGRASFERLTTFLEGHV